jgi:class 3 adenylate cyclase
LPTVQPETHYTRGKEGHVGYQVVGGGPFDLVLNTNWLTCVDAMWEEPTLAGFLGYLGKFSRVLCFDKRGTGVSDPVPLAALPPLEPWNDDVRAVMDAAGSARAAILGHGEGGPMAILFAATYPERTSALILVDTFARLLQDVDYPHGYPADRVPKFLATFARLWGTPPFIDLLAPSRARDERFRRWYARYEGSPWGPVPRRPSTPRSSRMTSGPCWRRSACRRSSSTGLAIVTSASDAVDTWPSTSRGRSTSSCPGRIHLFHLGETDTLIGEVEEFLTGARSVSEPDRVLATVLFTDIVGSTEQAAALGDAAWRDLLAAHHDVVRGELGRFRGREVGTTGDGFIATFDGPARAIRCASAIRDGVRSLGIEIRAGLHTGECEVMAGDVGGIAVHIGARVAATAAPSEVLVSSTVRDLVAGSGLRFVDHGAHSLHGVPGEWRLFAVAEG